MDKKKKRNNRQYTQWIVTSLILFAYFLIILLNYSSQMKNSTSDRVSEELEAHSENTAREFEKSMSFVAQAAETTARILANQDNMMSQESVDMVKAAVESSSSTYGFISDMSGNAKDIMDNTFSVWDNREYAQALMGTKVISDMEPVPGTENCEIKFYVPVVSEGISKGVLCMVYNTSEFEKLVRASDHDGHTLYAIMKSDGTLANMVGINRIRESCNLYDIISDSAGASVGSAIKRLRQNLDNGKSGQQFCKIKSEERFITYQMVGTNGWYIIEMYSRSYFNSQQTRYFKNTKKVITEIMVALSLFFSVIIFINIFSRALYNKKSEELQSKAETDLLTGLLNKMATEKHIQDYIEGEGSSVPGMLFVLDIDNFKKINDTMGHAFGDTVLSTLGIRLRNQFRISDIIGRIGGDEFIVYLKNINDEETIKREAERMVTFFKDFQAGDYVKYSATASIGVALYPQDGGNFEELYKAADKGVYLSKQRGKNQLAFYRETKVNPNE